MSSKGKTTIEELPRMRLAEDFKKDFHFVARFSGVQFLILFAQLYS